METKDIINEEEIEVCEYCNDTGEIEEGEFDDFVTKKCICQIEQ